MAKLQWGITRILANRIGELLESTTIDEWHHVLSGDNPADTRTRGFPRKPSGRAAGLLARAFSGLLIGRLYPTNVWPKKFVWRVLLVMSIFAWASSPTYSPSWISNLYIKTSIKNPKNGFNWGRFRCYRRHKIVMAFKLRMLPSHKHFRGKDLRITDPTELDIAEKKNSSCSDGILSRWVANTRHCQTY